MSTPASFLILFFGCMAACSSELEPRNPCDPNAPVELQRDRTSIGGTVVAEDGAPVAGAEVRLLEAEHAETTDAEGAFRLTQVSPGTHSLRASAPGFTPSEQVVIVSQCEATELPGPLRLEHRRARLAGRVALEDGRSPADTRVSLLDGPSRLIAEADSEGTFVFAGVRHGQYRVRARRPGYADAEAALEVDGDVEDVALRLALDPGRISGRILPEGLSLPEGDEDCGEDAPAGSAVELEGAEGRTGLTDCHGRFAFEGLAAGTYALRASRPGTHRSASLPVVQVVAATTTALGDLRLDRLTGRARVHFQFADAEAAPELVARALETAAVQGTHESLVRAGLPASEGSVLLPDLPTGTWRLVARAEDYLPVVLEAVEVRSDAETEVEVRLQIDPGGLLGRVLAEGVRAVADEIACGEAEEGAAGSVVEVEGSGGLVTTRSDCHGRFRVDGLRAGPVTLRARRGDTHLEHTARAQVLAGEVTGVGELPLTRARGGVAIQLGLADADARQPEVVERALLDATLNLTGPEDRQAGVDLRGEVTLQRLPVGAYLLRARTPGYLPVERALEVGVEHALQPLAVALELQPDLSSGLTGRLSSEVGALEWSRIAVFSLDGLPTDVDFAAEHDVFQILGLRPGLHALAIHVPGHRPFERVVQLASGRVAELGELSLEALRVPLRARVQLDGEESHDGVLIRARLRERLVATTQTDEAGDFLLELTPEAHELEFARQDFITQRAVANHEPEAGAFDLEGQVFQLARTPASDRDRDGLIDLLDNCPATANPLQGDVDGDGRGDHCDRDADGDGVANGLDGCPLAHDPMQEGKALDGRGIACTGASLDAPMRLGCGLHGFQVDTRGRPDQTAGSCGGRGSPELAFRINLFADEQVSVRVRSEHLPAIYARTEAGDELDCSLRSELILRPEEDGVYDIIIDGAGGADVAGEVVVDLFRSGCRGSFARVQRHPVGDSGAYRLDLGDVNGDAWPDVVVAAQEANQLTVMLGGPMGLDEAPDSPIDLDEAPWAAALIDLDEDGALDLAIGHVSGAITTLRGLGDGGFAAWQSLQVARQVTDFCALDVDQDGSAELLVAQGGRSYELAVFRRGGDGLVAAEPLALPQGDVAPGQIWCGDLDADGATEVVMLQEFNRVARLHRDDEGDLTEFSHHAVGASASDLHVADVDGDGVADVMATTAGGVALLRGAPGPAFAPAGIVPDTRSSVFVDSGDGDGDGAVDLVVAALDPRRTDLLAGRDGGFAVGATLAATIGGGHRLADVNGDGAAELLQVDRTFSALRVRATDQLRPFAPAQSHPHSSAEPRWLAGADLDGDGWTDFAWGAGLAPAGYGLVYGRPGARFGPEVEVPAHRTRVGLVADMDGDGRPDLVGGATDEVNVLHQEAEGFGEPLRLNAGQGSINHLFAYDMEGDGDLDIIAAGASGTHVIHQLEPRRYGPPIPVTEAHSRDAWAGDLNGDGIEDVVATLVGEVRVFFGRGNVQYRPAQILPLNHVISDPFARATAVGDVTGDGRADIVTADGANALVRVFQNQGGSFGGADCERLCEGVAQGRCTPTPSGNCAQPLELSGPGRSSGSTWDAPSQHRASCGGEAPGRELVYALTATEDGVLCADLAVGDYDTVLYVRAESCEQGEEVACNDDAPGLRSGASGLEFEAVEGRRYFLFVDGRRPDAAGRYTLRIREGACPDACQADADCEAPTLCLEGECVLPEGSCEAPRVLSGFGAYTGSTADAPVEQRASCGRGADGAEVVHTATFEEGRSVCASTRGSSFDTVLHVRFSACDNPAAELACNDDLRPIAGGRNSALEFFAVPDTPYHLLVDGFGDAAGDYALSLTPGRCEDAGRCAAPIEITHGVYRGSTAEAPAERAGSCGAEGSEVVYAATFERAGRVCVSTAGSDYDTVLHLRRDVCDDPAREFGCNDDAPALSDGASSLEFDAEVGLTYFVFVDGADGVEGDYQLTLSEGPCRPPCHEDAQCDGEEICEGGQGCSEVCPGGTTHSVGVEPLQVVIADLDDDGVQDIVTANHGSGDLSFLRGLGGGHFAPERRIVLGAAPTGVWVGDLDRDGASDLVAISRTDQLLHVSTRPLFGTLGPGTRMADAPFEACPPLVADARWPRPTLGLFDVAVPRTCRVDRLELEIDYEGPGGGLLALSAEHSAAVNLVQRWASWPPPGRLRPQDLGALARFEGVTGGGRWTLQAAAPMRSARLLINRALRDPFAPGAVIPSCGGLVPPSAQGLCHLPMETPTSFILSRANPEHFIPLRGPLDGGFVTGQPLSVSVDKEGLRLELLPLDGGPRLAPVGSVEVGLDALPPAFGTRFLALRVTADPDAALPIEYIVTLR